MLDDYKTSRGVMDIMASKLAIMSSDWVDMNGPMPLIMLAQNSEETDELSLLDLIECLSSDEVTLHNKIT